MPCAIYPRPRRSESHDVCLSHGHHLMDSKAIRHDRTPFKISGRRTGGDGTIVDVGWGARSGPLRPAAGSADGMSRGHTRPRPRGTKSRNPRPKRCGRSARVAPSHPDLFAPRRHQRRLRQTSPRVALRDLRGDRQGRPRWRAFRRSQSSRPGDGNPRDRPPLFLCVSIMASPDGRIRRATSWKSWSSGPFPGGATGDHRVRERHRYVR